jgi:hypothetical protein
MPGPRNGTMYRSSGTQDHGRRYGRCSSSPRIQRASWIAAADTGNLRFYQRVGFRLLSVDRDAFTPATGYPDPIMIDGIPLMDRVWLSADTLG